VAQQLYEGIDIGEGGPTGLITYMRTDSYTSAAGCAAQCRSLIHDNFGAKYRPNEPNVYQASREPRKRTSYQTTDVIERRKASERPG